MISKSMSMVLALFTLLVLVVPAGVVLQGAQAQDIVNTDELIQETFDEVEQEIGQEAEQEAEQEQEQEQSNEQSADQSNTADVSQDEENNQINVGAGDGNVQENENDFGDDGAVVDQDNEEDQDAANLGVQNQDATQDIDQVQDAENFNFDLNVQVAQQVERQPPPPPPEEEEPPPTQPPGTDVPGGGDGGGGAGDGAGDGDGDGGGGGIIPGGIIPGGDGGGGTPGGGKVNLCHRPPGNPENTQTITVGPTAVPAHLLHGDTLGPCR